MSAENQPKTISRRDLLLGAAATGLGLTGLGGALYWWAKQNEADQKSSSESGETGMAKITATPQSLSEPIPTVQPTAIPRELSFPETGTYSKENLLRLQELEPQPKIDQRIGVVHVNGRYPREPEVGFFEYGVEVLTRLGFQTTEIALVPQEFTQHTGMAIPSGTTLDQLAQREDVAAVFNHPGLRNISVTTEVAGSGTVNAWQLPQEGAFNPGTLQATYEEYFRFASIILQRFGGNGKQITILGPNELDWHALGGTPGALGRTGEDIPEHALENARLYLNAYLRGIRDANRNFPEAAPLRTAVEINRVRDIWNGRKRILNAVLPALDFPPDQVGYSSYGTLDKGNLFPKALAEIKRYAPQSRVVVSEFGLPENRADVQERFTRQEVAQLYLERIQEALEGGIERFMIWQLTDNETTQLNPNNDQCNGFWLVRPDGSLTETYRMISRSFS